MSYIGVLFTKTMFIFISLFIKVQSSRVCRRVFIRTTDVSPAKYKVAEIAHIGVIQSSILRAIQSTISATEEIVWKPLRISQ